MEEATTCGPQPDVYVSNNGLGYHLWRSLNGVVILTQQIRQARDPSYAALLSHCRVHKPTDNDIEKLRDRIGAKVPNMQSATVTVRRHTLRQAIQSMYSVRSGPVYPHRPTRP